MTRTAIPVAIWALPSRPVEAVPELQRTVANASLEPWLEGSNPGQITQRTALWELLAHALTMTGFSG